MESSFSAHHGCARMCLDCEDGGERHLRLDAVSLNTVAGDMTESRHTERWDGERSVSFG